MRAGLVQQGLVCAFLMFVGCTGSPDELDGLPQGQGMSFASERELLAYVAKRGQSLGLGTPTPLDSEGGFFFRDGLTGDKAAKAERQLEAEVGGPGGVVIIAGVARALRKSDGEGAAVESKQSAILRCGGANFCTENTSFVDGAWLGLRKDVGGRTVQVSGGISYEYLSRFGSERTCPDGWELVSATPSGTTGRWSVLCRRLVGHNFLEIQTRFFSEVKIDGQTFFNSAGGGQGSMTDVPDLTIRQTFWSGAVHGVCSAHNSSGDGGSSFQITGAGSVPDNCRNVF